MTVVFRRSLSWLVLLTAAMSWLPSCGFGTAGVAVGMGGGGGSDASAEVKIYGLARDTTIHGLQPLPGQLVACEPVNGTVSFAANGVYAAAWRNSVGSVVASVPVRAMTSRRLAVCVPLGLPAGDYKVEFAFGDGRAELPVPVGAATPVANAAAAVADARSFWGSQRDALQLTAIADPDAARKARSLADLARLSGWLMTFDGAVSGLDAGSLRSLAEMLQANEELRTAEPSGPYVSVDLIAMQSAAAATLAEYGLMALAASSSAVAPAGSREVLESLLPASQQIGGLVAVLTAYDRWTKALARPCKPIEGSLEVAAADGSALMLRFNLPLPLRCRASCSSLTGADVGDARVATIATALGAAGARRGALLPHVAALVGSQVPGMSATPVVELVDLAASRLTLLSQSPMLPALVLESGSLRAAQVSFQPSPVQVDLRIAEVQLGTAEGTFEVALGNPLPQDLDMVGIQPGTFQMGSTVIGGVSEPVHTVTITQPFWMGKFEVKQTQYQAVMGANPSFFQSASGPDARPVEMVSWDSALNYCNLLSEREYAAGRLPSGYVYRLPTEAEWEYCCRAGTTTEWSVGSSLTCPQANYLGCFGGQTAVVGSYAANAWGLHDMSGNVWEWCLDTWGGISGYAGGAVTDPFVGNDGPYRVLRGGGWDGSDLNCRSAYRGHGLPRLSFNFAGFRVVLAPVL